MEEKKLITLFRTTKIIQLSILILFALFYLIVLFCNPALSKELYNNTVLFTLCACMWSLMLFSLLGILFDFLQLRRFAMESHELNREAYLDDLTGIPNRHGLDVIFKTYDSPESMATVGCFMGTISNLPTINETLGHDAGNQIILDFCNIFEEVGDLFGHVGRNGGNEYVMVANHCTHPLMQQFADRLTERIQQYNSAHEKTPIDFQSTYLLNSEVKSRAFTQLLTATYNKLHM